MMLLLQRPRRIATLWMTLAVLWIGVSIAQEEEEATHETPLLESCRQDGFDPWQLSCETCDLLPTTSKSTSINPQERCLECCQSYKKSSLLTRPYESAVLVHRQEGADSQSEMAQFLNEHWEGLVQEKGSKRLSKLVRSDDSSASSSYGFMWRRPAPQLILWFDEIVPPNLKLKEYKNVSKEVINLDGYKKDDIKDMLSTLLPESKTKK
ncbi:expressed unknown protein [Seminavis robusta]|uniref:Selenoprotein F/M domain-containing protein n=1 Tax=Seminavis robusta TaxID=568900 RepID=A0A9N8DWF3_9STRA|nr:expressed unknown protein [Seminavis robusta]|eukprot:Sro414_g138350.1 n/a (209) ;mRNA; f:55004-55630